MKKVIAYTDGSCSTSTGDGGYGVLLIWNNYEKELFGGDSHTTANRMELTAAIKALEALTERCRVTIYSDSLYVVNAFRKEWIKLWIKKDFRGIKNSDLWKRLLKLTTKHRVEFQWVKGHNGNPGNVKADELAAIGRETYVIQCQKRVRLSNDSKKGSAN